jgi:beta-lactamase superfamily II metal-dependent hydrolase
VNCEIEFLAVGGASRAGDCIVVRYGTDQDYKLMVVDGGTAETGETLVAHLKKYYRDAVRIEHCVLTHSDADHASGLRTLLEKIPVANLWMHVPWLLAEQSLDLFANKNWTKEGLKKEVHDKYDILDEILRLAWATPCQVRYPWQGAVIGPFTVLSPSSNVYRYLLPQFDKTPDPDQSAIEAAGLWVAKGATGFLEKALAALVEAAQKLIEESWTNERLKDGGCTAASNESSVVMYADLGNNQRVLLTGDAGVRALQWSCGYANSQGMILTQFSFVQIPHHGSRRNVGPTVLNQLIGPIQPEGTLSKFVAFVSAPADDSKHPRKIVTNAFRRRGANVLATQGQHKVHWGGLTPRSGYQPVQGVPFHNMVEDYD